MKYATFLVSALILVGVLTPGPDLPDVDIGGYDKLVHIAMFAVWTLAVQFDFRTQPARYYLIILAGLLFSLLTELLQIPVEGRSFDLFDMAADSVGILSGLLINGPLLRILDRVQSRLRKPPTSPEE